MDGRLRSDLVQRLRATTEASQLVVAMGTSLSGVAADQLVSSIGQRAKREADADVDNRGEARGGSATSHGCDHSGGAVIINIQQTRLDGLAALRIFAPVDEVCRQLATLLQVTVPDLSPELPRELAGTLAEHGAGFYQLPYDAESGELRRDESTAMTLDLNVGQRVRLAQGNAPMAVVGTTGTVGQRTGQGHFTINFDDGVTRFLGLWMLEAGQRGELAYFPIVPLRTECECTDQSSEA